MAHCSWWQDTQRWVVKHQIARSQLLKLFSSTTESQIPPSGLSGIPTHLLVLVNVLDHLMKSLQGWQIQPWLFPNMETRLALISDAPTQINPTQCWKKPGKPLLDIPGLSVRKRDNNVCRPSSINFLDWNIQIEGHQKTPLQPNSTMKWPAALRKWMGQEMVQWYWSLHPEIKHPPGDSALVLGFCTLYIFWSLIFPPQTPTNYQKPVYLGKTWTFRHFVDDASQRGRNTIQNQMNYG